MVTNLRTLSWSSLLGPERSATPDRQKVVCVHVTRCLLYTSKGLTKSDPFNLRDVYVAISTNNHALRVNQCTRSLVIVVQLVAIGIELVHFVIICVA